MPVKARRDEYNWYLRYMRGELSAQQVVDGYANGEIDIPQATPLTGNADKDYWLIQDGMTTVVNPWLRPLHPIPPSDADGIHQARENRARHQRTGEPVQP